MSYDPSEATRGAPPHGAARRGWASAAALVAALLLIALVILIAVSNRERDAALTRQRHSYEVLIMIRGLDTAMARSEAALGRFAISGERPAGVLYYDQWRLAGMQLQTLAGLTAADPKQRPLVAQLVALYDTRGQELAGPAARARARQGWSALSAYDTAGDAPSVARIAAVLDQIAANERSTLADVSVAAERSVARSNLLAALLSVLGLLLVAGGILLGLLVVRAVHARREAGRRADVQADRAESLEDAVAQRTRELRQANAALLAEAATRAAAEARLHQAQKMEAIGQLTGGIAHDFNNMLSVVVGGIELAQRRRLAGMTDYDRHLDHALDGANRAAALTRRLLAFARAEPLLPESVDPGRLIAGMSELIDRTLGERITVVTALAPDGWAVWCDPSQLENAILNLAVNARDAMPDGGRLTIETGNVTLAAGDAGEARPGDYLRIAVRDSGCGMPGTVLERVFEPFFTTKPLGQGTGLGLSQIFGFVRQSTGEVLIDSAEGSGTCVALFLPRHANAATAAALPASDPAATVGRGEPVLVVEDDPRVRVATVEALAELGYLPLPCAAGDAALAILAGRDDIRLVVTDVVMPGMTGPELVDEIGRRYPHIAAIFVTGYVGEAGDADRLRGGEVLRKPFTLARLAAAVAAALAAQHKRIERAA